MLNKPRCGVPYVQIAGASAIGFALLIVTTNLVLVPAGMPPPGAPAAEAVEFFTSTNGSTATVSALLPAAWALATLFGAGALAAVLRRGGQAVAGWAYAGFAGVLLQNATFTAVVALRLAMATLDDAAAVTTLRALHEALFGFNGTFLALAMVGLGTAGFVAGLLARWQLVLGSVAAFLQFTSASLTPLIMDGHEIFGLLGLTGWLLWVLWLLCYGVALIRRTSAVGTAENSGCEPD